MVSGEWRMEEEDASWRGHINSYRDLRVWQDAMTLAESAYTMTRSFPKEEMFGMVSQIRRAAVSIAANIAEGHGRESTAYFVNFLRIAQGSLKELETHLLLSSRVGLVNQTHCDPMLSKCDTLGKRLRALIRTLQRKTAEATA
jgi:four helix bundle protein